eukprot:942755-Pleurochrysis_carterae.AAC.3
MEIHSMKSSDRRTPFSWPARTALPCCRQSLKSETSSDSAGASVLGSTATMAACCLCLAVYACVRTAPPRHVMTAHRIKAASSSTRPRSIPIHIFI